MFRMCCPSKREKLRGDMSMMNRFRSLVARLHNDERGQGLVEYVLVVAFLVLVATASMSTIATSIGSIFKNLDNVLKEAVTQSGS